MDIKKIMDKFEPVFLKDENSRLPQELFEGGAGNSLVGGVKLKSLSLKEVSMIKGPDFEKFSKPDQEIAIKIAEWWFDRFYATIKKPIIVPIEKNKASQTIDIKPVSVDIKPGIKRKNVISGQLSQNVNKTDGLSGKSDNLDFYKALKDSPVRTGDVKNKK